MRKKLALFFESNKYLKKKKNQREKHGFNTLPRTFLASLIIVTIFFVSPIIVDFSKNTSFTHIDFENNSKKDLTHKLNSKKNKPSDEKDLLIDIFSLNDLESDTVRLNASTIEQLFKDTNYNLSDVRKNKLVKPVNLTLLPKEIKMIENTKKKKEFFIQIILPLILKENNNIRIDRKRLFSIINKSNNTKLEKAWLKKKYKQYGIPSKDL